MNIFKTTKCICCLVKCSKYLYFAKKLLCIFTLLLTGVFLMGFFVDSSKVKNLLKGKA